MGHRESVVAAAAVVAAMVVAPSAASPLVADALAAPFAVLVLTFPLLSLPSGLFQTDRLRPGSRLVLVPATVPHH